MLSDAYVYAELGYLKKMVKDDVDIDAIEDLIDFRHNDKEFKTHLRDKMVREYINKDEK